MANSVIIERHFKTLKRVLEENDLLNKRDKIFNTDESGINVDLRQGRVVVSCGSKQAHFQSKGSRDHITVNCGISVAGAALPPVIIFEKSFHFLHTLPNDPLMSFMPSPQMAIWMKSCFIAGFLNSLSHKPTTWGNKF